MPRDKSWSGAQFQIQAINANDYVYAQLSTPGFSSEQCVIERIVGDVHWMVSNALADGQYGCDEISMGIVVLPTELVTLGTPPPPLEPFLGESDLEWIWTAHCTENWRFDTPNNEGKTFLHIHVDAGARRRINLSSETLWLHIINGSANPIMWSAGLRWLASF